MLFNSEIFILIFLPITLLGFFILGGYQLRRLAIFWLVLASTIFYGWFRVDYLILLGILIVINYLCGIKLARQYHKNQPNPSLLFIGIAINLGVLFYYKYTNFLIENLNAAFGTTYVLHNIILPIGISFFIFQKIAYLVDSYRGEAEEYNFLDFCLFVMYFPQLIAGPIVHHKELIPQFRNLNLYKLNPSDLAGGIIMFTIGLCKKNLIADQLASWVQPVFTAAKQGIPLSFLEAWGSALGFTFQIYFDFSAYTDMALGLALMIGIRLPLNFNSPYKAKSIIDFWRKWHMSLSRFLRDYVYIPLGGNRQGSKRRFINLMLTMLIGGIWHGAAWSFVLWGALHGLYLMINHAWRALKIKFSLKQNSNWFYSTFAQLTTFLAVIVAWVFFRAENIKSAFLILKGMLGFHGVILPSSYESNLGFIGSCLKTIGIRFENVGITHFSGLKEIVFLLCTLLIVWVLPNTQQWCSQFKPALGSIKSIKLNRFWRRLPGIQQNNDMLTLTASGAAGIISALVISSMLLWQNLKSVTLNNFIYFQF